MGVNKNEVRIPDVSVIVSAAGFDVAVICFYAGEHPSDGFEVVSGISDPDALPVVRTLLQDCLTALLTDDWHAVDELDSRVVSDEGGEFPF